MNNVARETAASILSLNHPGGHRTIGPTPVSINHYHTDTMVATRRGIKQEGVGTRNINRPVPVSKSQSAGPPSRVSRREIEGMIHPYTKSQYRNIAVPRETFMGGSNHDSVLTLTSSRNNSQYRKHETPPMGSNQEFAGTLGHTQSIVEYRNTNADHPNVDLTTQKIHGTADSHHCQGQENDASGTNFSGRTVNRISTEPVQIVLAKETVSDKENNGPNHPGCEYSELDGSLTLEVEQQGVAHLENGMQEQGYKPIGNRNIDRMSGEELLDLADFSDQYDPRHDPRYGHGDEPMTQAQVSVVGAGGLQLMTQALVSVDEEGGQEEDSVKVAYRSFLQKSGLGDDDNRRASEVRSATRTVGWKEYKLLNKSDLEYDSPFAKLILTDLGLYPVRKDLVVIKDNWNRIKRDVKDGMSQARSSATQKIQKSFFGT